MISYTYIYVAFMNLNAQPTSHFKTILSTNTLASKKSLSSIVKDLKKSPGMSEYQKRLVKRTVYDLNTNPNAVVTNRESKAVVAAMRDRGHLKSEYHHNLGAAIHEVQRSHVEKISSGKITGKEDKEIQEKRPSRREKIRQEKRERARIDMLNRERREEAEMEEKGIRYTVGRNVQVSAGNSGGMSEEVKKSDRDRFEKNQAIDMMID